VFNADQIEGWRAPEERRLGLVGAIETAEQFVANTKAEIRHGGDRAFYRQKDDFIQVPDMDLFTGTPTSSPTESYYAVLLHELTHWTGHKRRLDRDLTGRFGDESYAMEELVAELGAAFLCADLGISNGPRDDHAAYVANWLKVLKNDKKAIFTAASKAGQAADYLSRLETKKATEAGGPPTTDEREPVREAEL
jgi:antirestriction protein ArdC